MAYNQPNPERVRQALAGQEYTEKNMFGSRGFMVNSKLAVCVRENDIMYKVSPEEYAAAIAEGRAKAMEMRGRMMKNWLHMDNEKLADENTFSYWLRAALSYNRQATGKNK
jgi:TfoX/Sxy family transcriptional regulator of competence genes